MLFEFEDIISVDTETSGLNPYLGDLPFGFSFANSSTEIYLDDRRDSKHIIFDMLQKAFENPDRTCLLYNAKFDMHHISQWCVANGFDPVKFLARIVDIPTLARIVNNDRFQTSMEVIAREYGMEKSKAVEEWIRKNKAYRMVGDEKVPDYTAVPHDIISVYAMKDARITYDLYFKMLQDLTGLENYLKTLNDERSIYNVIEREALVTKALYKIEATGVLTDPSLLSRANDIAKQGVITASARYKEITGRDLVDSGKAHAAAFIGAGYSESDLARTSAGNYSFTNEVLSSNPNELTSTLSDFRDATKKANTVYSGLLNSRDPSGRIHTNFRQDATRTGRLSSNSPNLQNIAKERVGEIFERDCFIPDTNCTLVAVDYKAQEMRLLFDMSGEVSVAKRIMEGEDVHEVTAALMGVKRKMAKDVGFSLVYGKGVKQLALDLGISFKDAQDLKKLFFDRMPHSAKFIKSVIAKAERGFIANAYGRVFRFNRDIAYKAPNYLIQGTGSEIGKDAFVSLVNKYNQENVQVVLAVHDELVFNINDEYLSEMPNICSIMTGVYKHNILPMDVSVKMSKESWGKCE